MDAIPLIGGAAAVCIVAWALILIGKKLERGNRTEKDLEVAQKFNEALQKWSEKSDLKKNEIETIKKEARDKFNRGELNAGDLVRMLDRARSTSKNSHPITPKHP